MSAPTTAMDRLREAADVAPAYYGDKIDSSEPAKKAFNLTHGDARALLRLVEAVQKWADRGDGFWDGFDRAAPPDAPERQLRAALAAITGEGA